MNELWDLVIKLQEPACLFDNVDKINVHIYVLAVAKQ